MREESNIGLKVDLSSAGWDVEELKKTAWAPYLSEPRRRLIMPLRTKYMEEIWKQDCEGNSRNSDGSDLRGECWHGRGRDRKYSGYREEKQLMTICNRACLHVGVFREKDAYRHYGRNTSESSEGKGKSRRYGRYCSIGED